MTQDTPLDTARAAMEAAPEDDNARLAFYARLAESELCLMLSEEAAGESISPELFDVDGGRYVLAFDREDRLAAFAGRPAPYAAIPGRALAEMLAEQGIGLGVNLDRDETSALIPSEALGWLKDTLGHAPAEAEARPEEVSAPGKLPEGLLVALDEKLARAAGLARRAYLAEVTYEGGAKGHLLGITGTADGAEPTLARAINEALVFSGLEAGALDVTFLAESDPLAARLARVALRFDLPDPEDPKAERAVPGSDPEKPPRLR